MTLIKSQQAPSQVVYPDLTHFLALINSESITNTPASFDLTSHGTRDNPIIVDDNAYSAHERRQNSRECAICLTVFVMRDAPNQTECRHATELCSECFSHWVTSELDSKSWDRVKCPGSECKILLPHTTVRSYASLKVFNRYDDLCARSALAADPNFYPCMRPGCRSGVIHEPRFGENISQCGDCGHRICITHQVPWHEGETCNEYERRLKRNERRIQREIERQSRGIIEGLTKCPKCNTPIEKNGGCDHMTCKCKHEFCWVCSASFDLIREIGNSAHKKDCQYHTGRLS